MCLIKFTFKIFDHYLHNNSNLLRFNGQSLLTLALTFAILLELAGALNRPHSNQLSVAQELTGVNTSNLR